MSSSFNSGLIEGLWRARNRETDTLEERATIRSWLRQCIGVERARREAIANAKPTVVEVPTLPR